MPDAPADAGPGTLITIAPAAGEIGHLLRTAIDAEQVGATRLHLATDQPDLLLVMAALREQTALVLTCDEPVPGADVIGSGFLDIEVADAAVLSTGVVADPDLPAVITEVARLVAVHPSGVALHARGRLTLPVLLASLAAGGHLLVGAPEPSGSRSGRDCVALVARASGLARIAGRPPLPGPAARAVLGLA